MDIWKNTKLYTIRWYELSKDEEAIFAKYIQIFDQYFDASYTKEIKNRKYQSIIQGFCTIAQKNSIKSWIRMVEDEQSFGIVKELKIDYIQGKYLASLEMIEEKK